MIKRTPALFVIIFVLVLTAVQLIRKFQKIPDY